MCFPVRYPLPRVCFFHELIMVSGLKWLMSYNHELEYVGYIRKLQTLYMLV